jgi:Rod binding domain-containing protein
MTTPTPTSARSYLDFQGLASLRGQAARAPDQAVRATAEQFEAHFIQQMMKAMRDTVEKSELVDNDHADMYQDLMDKEVAMQMVRRGGMGLADMLEKQMLLQQSQAAASAGPTPALQQPGQAATMVPLHTPRNALPLQPEAKVGLPLERTGAFELQRRSGGQP